MKIDTFIPVIYIGGSGGNFLASFITAAILDDDSTIKFSRFGNAHDSNVERISLHTTDNVDDIYSLVVDRAVTNLPIIVDSICPKYILLQHNQYQHLDAIIALFKKVLLISYDENDIDEIAQVYIAKHTVDTEGKKFDSLLKEEYVITAKRLKDLQKLYQNIYGDHVDIISWKELFKEDPILLINKLSNYSGYPAEKFSLNKLNEWRRLTTICIEKISRFTQ